MVATQEGRLPRGKMSLRIAIGWIVGALIFVFVLSIFKESELQKFAQSISPRINTIHLEVRNSFQANFYFFYESQFLSGIQEKIKNKEDLKRIRILNPSGKILFDSNRPEFHGPSKDVSQLPKLNQREMVTALEKSTESIFFQNFDVHFLKPSGQFSILYTFQATSVQNQIISFFLLGALLIFALIGLFRFFQHWKKWKWPKYFELRFSGLRAKFLLTIALINLITGTIIYITLSELQTREQTERIKKDSILFSRVATDKVITDFSNYSYFYYQDKFVPSIKSIIASHEDLVGIRIISNRLRNVLFDSENVGDEPVLKTTDQKKVHYDSDLEIALQTRKFVTREILRNGEKLLKIINVFQNENQERLFFVEYLFSYYTPTRSVAAMRKQILIDLIPSMIIGFLIAWVFSQFLISPIRRLSQALKRVTQGDFDISVDVHRRDEIGSLVNAFNTMTGELRKKKELRKYLSDSTYRQIMEATEKQGDSGRLTGTRVNAAVLFCDIRNFVSHCENLDAEEVTGMLNDYFSDMVDVVYRNGGEIDKFIGDALLAVFYEPTDEFVEEKSAASPTLNAVYCALEMRQKLEAFNQKRLQAHKTPLEIGVGITYGEIISGPIGARDRMDFTVIGDVVNLASRIEKISKQGKFTRIVFSNHVEEKIRGLLDYEEIKGVEVRGKVETVTVFELVQIRDLKSLVQNLDSKDKDLRQRSVELLGRSRNIEAIPFILNRLTDPIDTVRVQAVIALTRLSGKDNNVVLDEILSRLTDEKSEKVISASISAVGVLCTSKKILELSEYLKSKNERIVANTIEALGKVNNPDAVDLMLPFLSSRNNRIKANAAMALFSAGHFSVIETLKPMLMHSDPLMRSSAAFAIGELTLLAHHDHLLEEWRRKSPDVKMFLGELQESVPMLVSLLKDAEPMVKRQAIIALGKIKDKTSVLPIIDNIDFDKDSKEMIEEVAQALRSIGSHKLVREILAKHA